MRSYKVYNCNMDRGLMFPVTCIFQGSFKHSSSAVERLSVCGGTRAWIEKSGNDVTAELMATAPPQIKGKLAEQILAFGMEYGRAEKGVKS